MPVAISQCESYGQRFVTLGFNGSEFQAVCMQENPCKLIFKLLKGGLLE